MQNFFGNSELLCKSGMIAASSTAWRASGLVAATLPQPASSCGVEEHTGCGADEPSPTAAAEEPSPTAADFRVTRPTTTSDFHCSQISN